MIENFLRTQIVEQYNKAKNSDTRCFYSDNGKLVEMKNNGYTIIYHYDYIEQSDIGFFNDYELDEAINYLRCIYDIDEDDDKSLTSYIRLWSKGRNIEENEWDSIKLAEVFDNTDRFREILNNMRNCNMFISPNTFSCKNHKMNSLMGINAITIDLDYKKTLKYSDCTSREIIKILEEKFFYGNVNEFTNEKTRMPRHMIPRPNFIEYGNQIRLIYLVDKIKLSKKGRRKIIKFVKVIKKKIENRLEEFGADSSPNLNSFIRVPYSINKKVNYKTCYIVKPKEELCYRKPISEDRYMVDIKEYSRRRYNIQDIADSFIERKKIEKYIECIKESKKKGIAIKNKRHGGLEFNEYNLMRLRDIEKLQGLKNKGKVTVHRENLCFVYMAHLKLLGYDETTILNRTKLFIGNFNDNKDEKSLISKCKNVMKNDYKFTTVGIREFFNIDIEFCKKYSLKSFIGVEYTKEERKEYSRKYYLEYLRGERKYFHLDKNKIEVIFKLNSEGKEVKEIAEAVGCKIQTVYRYIKKEEKAVKRVILQSIEAAIEYLNKGIGMKEIAEKFNIPYETLRKRVYRYKKKYSI